jgi:hypothetical protein
MSVRCPFYGFRWPEKSCELVPTGGNECGLDLDANGSCKMEQEGRTVSYDYCPVALNLRPVLDVFKERIAFRPAGELDRICLADRLVQITKGSPDCRV